MGLLGRASEAIYSTEEASLTEQKQTVKNGQEVGSRRTSPTRITHTHSHNQHQSNFRQNEQKLVQNLSRPPDRTPEIHHSKTQSFSIYNNPFQQNMQNSQSQTMENQRSLRRNQSLHQNKHVQNKTPIPQSIPIKISQNQQPLTNQPEQSASISPAHSTTEFNQDIVF